MRCDLGAMGGANAMRSGESLGRGPTGGDCRTDGLGGLWKAMRLGVGLDETGGHVSGVMGQGGNQAWV